MSVLGKMLVAQEVDKVAPGAGDPVARMLMRNTGRLTARTPDGNVEMAGDYQDYARQKARSMFGKGHFKELQGLWGDESGWDPTADNPTSTASGIPQFLASTWENYGGYTKNPYKQINKGLRYIADRYGDPSGARAFQQATMHDNASLAPKGLADLAKYWISKGYVGY